MAGYVIHLAIGEEYIRKHSGDIKNKEEFIRGIIEPDKTTDKLKSHFGEKDFSSSLKNFINARQQEMDDDFVKGYFLHLFTDYIFYGKYFKKMHYFEDYDRTNKIIIEKYNVKVPQELEQYATFVNEEPQYLKYELLYEIIELVTQNTINENIKEILKGEYDEYKD